MKLFPSIAKIGLYQGNVYYINVYSQVEEELVLWGEFKAQYNSKYHRIELKYLQRDEEGYIWEKKFNNFNVPEEIYNLKMEHRKQVISAYLTAHIVNIIECKRI